MVLPSSRRSPLSASSRRLQRRSTTPAWPRLWTGPAKAACVISALVVVVPGGDRRVMFLAETGQAHSAKSMTRGGSLYHDSAGVR